MTTVTIGDLIERNALYNGEKEAFIFESQRVTYAEFSDRVHSLSASLYDLGLRRQDRVAILATNCIQYFEVQGAAELSGYISVMVNFRLAAQEIIQVLNDADAKILIFENQFAETVATIRSSLRGITQYVAIGAAVENTLSYEHLIDQGATAGAPIRARSDDICYLYYTSGSTGRPKGVPHNHRSAWHAGDRTALTLCVDGTSKVLQVTPGFHVGGKGLPLAALLMGGTTMLLSSFNSEAMLKAFHDEKVTHTFMVEAMLQAILSSQNLGKYDVSSLVSIMTGGAPIPVPLLKRGINLFGQIFTVQYGMTELFSVLANLPAHEVNPFGSEADLRRLASVGHVMPEHRHRILDDNLNDCKNGVVGEVVVKSDYMTSGYWNNSVASIETFRDGWYHTGDLGFVDEHGYLYLVDRKKDMIITGGENVYSREVENALFQHSEVEDVAVIGVPDQHWGESIKAIVALKRGAAVTADELIQHCKALIASYKCPKGVEFVATLPRLPAGKVDKIALRKMFSSTSQPKANR